MKKLFFMGILIPTIFQGTYGQKRADKTAKELKFPLTAQYWEYDPATATFIQHRGTPAVKGVDGGAFQIKLKDYEFTTGIIEYDIELVGQGFPAINFRMSEDGKYGDHFYIRSFGPVSDDVRTSLQYAAIINGVSMWDITDEYQAGAEIFLEGWNHVKLVVSQHQLLAYVNNMERPVMRVPELEGGRSSGNIELNGNVIYANLVVRPGETEGLPDAAGYISTYNDSRYLREWEVMEPLDLPLGQDLIVPLPGMYQKLDNKMFPDSTTRWTPMSAESRGVVNLSRKFKPSQNGDRKLVWLKTTIHSDKDQNKTVDLGFSDEVWIVANGQVVYTDKNLFGGPVQKFPKGRCTIENAQFVLPLKEGANEIYFGVARYFYGWGLIARLRDMDGIDIP